MFGGTISIFWENNTMTKKKIWQIAGICCLCVCVLAVGVLGVVFGMNHTTEPVNLATVDTQDEIIEYEMSCSNGIELFMSSAPEYTEFSYSRTITAVVMPEYAINKEVDWSLEWVKPDGEFELQNEPSDFVVIEPHDEDSRIAEVHLEDSFSGHDILIVCTTRVGGCRATCTVRYLGIPRWVSLGEYDGLLYENELFCIEDNSTATIDFVFGNPFGGPSSEYLNNYLDVEITVEAVGTVVMQEVWVSISDDGIYRDLVNVDLSTLSSVSNITVTIVDGKLQLTSTGAIESAYRSISLSTPPSIEYLRGYQYYSGAENCYWLVTITDLFSGASESFKVAIYSNASSVDVQDEIIF